MIFCKVCIRLSESLQYTGQVLVCRHGLRLWSRRTDVVITTERWQNETEIYFFVFLGYVHMEGGILLLSHRFWWTR